MKEYDDLDILEWISIVEEEINVKSDRAMVVTCASILDAQLEILLRKFLIRDKKIDMRLFGSNNALSTFSSKQSMCYYLGIISEYEFDTIEIIRKIRNRFAHEFKIKKMTDDQSIVDLCNNLALPSKLYIPETLKINNGKIVENLDNPLQDLDVQERFIRVFKNLTMYLNYRSIEISDIRREKYENLTVVEMFKDTKKKNMI